MDADGLDTAIGVLGPVKGLALVDSRPDTAALVVVRGDGGPTLHASRRMTELAGRTVTRP
jgi:thiamine biosynthesis lipoprotein ApbE